MLQIRDLRKSYGAVNVLKGLNMNIERGDVYGFLGKNGCGKTTTMNILCNIIKKDGGEIRFQPKDNGEAVRIGYLTETPAMYGYMNAEEYLEYIAACARYSGDTEKRTKEVLETVGMSDRAKYRIKTYSRGMNQRVGIAAAIFAEPDLLVLDEPTSALDPQGRSEVMEIITRLSGTGCTIILCTHILSDVERVANKIGIIANGVMVIEDTIQNLLNGGKSNGVELKIFDPDARKMSVVKGITFANEIIFNEKTGSFMIYGQDPDTLSRELVQFLADNGIVPEKLSVIKPDLEEIYLKAVNNS